VVLLTSTPADVRDSVEKLGVAHQLRILGSLAKPASLEAVQLMLERAREPRTAGTQVVPDYFSMSAAEVVGLLPTGIEVHYQSIHEASTGEVCALEALARLRHPSYGLVGPTIFVPICEQAGAATRLLMLVLSTALADLARLRSHGHDDIRMAVNVSAADLISPTLVDDISEAARHAGVPADGLILELTENRALADSTLPTEILTRLRVRGFGVAVDDYGTGYASLKQLRHIPFSELKIDQGFVRDAHNDERKRVMLASTVTLARELGMVTVAEGVETAEEYELLKDLDCELIQGYFFSRPAPIEEVSAALANS
jgi:EAL domain-containing protein (putative c-di-GMP-specific phosphodiesterase class I)